jgi:hypothetical protein
LALAVVAALAEILALLVETQYLDQSLLSVVVVVVRITSDQLREVPVVVQVSRQVITQEQVELLGRAMRVETLQLQVFIQRMAQVVVVLQGLVQVV